MNAEAVVFWVLAILTVGSAAVVVLSRQLIYSSTRPGRISRGRAVSPICREPKMCSAMKFPTRPSAA